MGGRQDTKGKQIAADLTGAAAALAVGVASGEADLRGGENVSLATNAGTLLLGAAGYVFGGDNAHLSEAGKGAVHGSLALMGHQGRTRFARRQQSAEVEAKRQEQVDAMAAAAARAEAEERAEQEQQQQEKDPRFERLELPDDAAQQQQQQQTEQAAQ